MKTSNRHIETLVTAVVRKMMAEQNLPNKGDIQQRLDDYMQTWIKKHIVEIQEELESSAALTPDADMPTVGMQLGMAFMQNIIDESPDKDISLALAQDQEAIVSSVERNLTKIATKLWGTAKQAASESRASANYDRFGSNEDPHSYYGVSRDDF